MTQSDPINILLVEDNPADALLLIESLREAGADAFRVTRVARLAEAFEVLARGEALDVVMLDLSLPDSTGLETVSRMQAAAPRVPLVVLTGLQDESVGLEAMRQGIQDYLVKGQCEGGLAARAARYAVERARAESALRDREARLRAIVWTAVDAIITIDERGVIESANPATERMFGFAIDELIGQNVLVLMPDPYRGEHDGYLRRYLDTGEARIIGRGREVLGLRKDGTTFPLNLSVSVFDLGGRRMFTGVLHDMTERRRLEKEVIEASVNEQRRIGQDLHDGLCQELLGVAFGTEILAKRLADGAPEEVERVRKLGDQLEAVIAQARAIAHGLNPVDFQAGGLPEALKSMAAKLSEMFQVECRFRQTGLATIAVDDNTATHLYRIAQESVSNAIKHGKSTRVDISLAVSTDQLSLVVKDNGSGLTNPKPTATGHGLQIMAYRARLIGAVLDVSGAKGEGTTVTCHLRTVRSATASTESHSEDSTTTQDSGVDRRRRPGGKSGRSPKK